MRFSISANSRFDRCTRGFEMKSGHLRVDLNDDSVLIVDHHGEGKVSVTGDVCVEVRTVLSTYLKPDVQGARGTVLLESNCGATKIELEVEFGHKRNAIVVTGETSS
jgi:hypothetical protein